jgi:predicted glutamine amidotransferase
MCGIAGFSLTPDSNIKPRQLANALLCAIEDRGYMAAGYAWQMGEHMGFYKAPVTGSTLSLKGMPKNVKNVILHTRLATHGSTQDNRNNHPVLSPTEDIALVHNGVIYNHRSVRNQIDADLPDVDTSVIPALIEQSGVQALDNLDGDAAIAWFNKRDHNTLHLARYQHSPLVMCQVEDGSFIFCSTEALLWKVLVQLDLMPVWLETAKELDYFLVRDGKVIEQSMLPEPKYSAEVYDYSYYRHQTAGAKGNSTYTNDAAWHNNAWFDDSDDLGYWMDDDDINNYQPAYKKGELDACAYSPASAIRYEEASEFWTRIYDRHDKQETIAYYDSKEQNIWADELFLLSNQTGVVLIDYGKVVDGENVSLADEYIF